MNTITCPSCSAITSFSKTKCDFCGSNLVSEEVKPIKHLSKQIRNESVISDNIKFVRKSIIEVLKRNPELYKSTNSNVIDSYDIIIVSKTEKIEINVILANKINLFSNTPYTELKFTSINLLENINESMDSLRKFIDEINNNITQIKLMEFYSGVLYPYAFELINAKYPSLDHIRNLKEIYNFGTIETTISEEIDAATKNKIVSVGLKENIESVLKYIGLIESTEEKTYTDKLFDKPVESHFYLYKLSVNDVNDLNSIFKFNNLPIYSLEEIKSIRNKKITEFNEINKKINLLTDKVFKQQTTMDKLFSQLKPKHYLYIVTPFLFPFLMRFILNYFGNSDFFSSMNLFLISIIGFPLYTLFSNHADSDDSIIKTICYVQLAIGAIGLWIHFS